MVIRLFLVPARIVQYIYIYILVQWRRNVYALLELTTILLYASQFGLLHKKTILI